MIQSSNIEAWWSQSVFIGAAGLLLLLALAPAKHRKWLVPPMELPFLGHALALANSDAFYSVLSRWATEIGTEGIYEFSVFGQRWIVLCSAESVMKAM